VIHRRGPWRSFEAVEYATLEWVDWFNHRRLLEPIGNMPPAEAEDQYYAAANNIDMGSMTHNQRPPADPGRFTSDQCLIIDCQLSSASRRPTTRVTARSAVTLPKVRKMSGMLSIASKSGNRLSGTPMARHTGPMIAKKDT
jgi:hypothetical protein